MVITIEALLTNDDELVSSDVPERQLMISRRDTEVRLSRRGRESSMIGDRPSYIQRFYRRRDHDGRDRVVNKYVQFAERHHRACYSRERRKFVTRAARPLRGSDTRLRRRRSGSLTSNLTGMKNRTSGSLQERDT